MIIILSTQGLLMNISKALLLASAALSFSSQLKAPIQTEQQPRMIIARHEESVRSQATNEIWLALRGNDLESLEIWLQDGTGADINYQDPVTGDTALHVAIKNYWDAGAEFLVGCGARGDIKNNADETALDIARSKAITYSALNTTIGMLEAAAQD